MRRRACAKTFTDFAYYRRNFTPKNLLGGESRLLQRTQEPQANAVGEKCKKEERNWETSLKKRWGNLPQNLLAPQNGSAPEDQRDHESCVTSVKPW